MEYTDKNLVNLVKIDGDYYYTFMCPHCLQFILVHKNDLNCRIFRHAVYKKNFQPISPHSTKEVCDELLNTNQIFGCSKPFRIIELNGSLFVEGCPYI